MYNEIVKLVSVIESVDSYGDIVKTISEKVVFARLKSIGQTEFYQAKAVGLKPEIKFVIADYLDYSGEKLLKYAPYDGAEEEYSVIRVFREGNELEIVCRRGIEK